jgi:predicted membrane channel-forming protein YqfA (hemolysin III family)
MGNKMEILASVFSILMGLSTLMALAAVLFLQSRARGAAILIAASPLLVSGVHIEDREMIHGFIAAGSTNVGIIVLSLGVLLFALSLPSRRLQLDAEDRRPISDRIIKDTLDTKQAMFEQHSGTDAETAPRSSE